MEKIPCETENYISEGFNLFWGTCLEALWSYSDMRERRQEEIDSVLQDIHRFFNVSKLAASAMVPS